MSEGRSTNRAPRGLKEGGKRLWRSVTDTFDIEEHERLVLLQACRTADRLDALAAEDVPLTATNARGDKVAHPVLVEARQQSLTLARLIASLRIPDGDDNRPQARTIRGAYGVRGGSQ